MNSDHTITNLPSGVVAFLFTDIEGSTRLWERDPAAMWRAIERHNALLGQAIGDHRGHHFKTIGDAYQAAFFTPADAVAAAVNAQQAIAGEPWPDTGPIRVRMAIHMGEAEPSATGDYLAPSLNRLARLMSAGHGGQVLLSAAVHDALAGVLPPGVAELALGRHRLRDLLEAEDVWQLIVPGAPDAFPPLKSLEGFPNNLPRQPTEIIGRDDQIALLRAMLTEENTRLLTLTGPGGIGKTRLALAVAAEALEAFPDGVFFVPLAGITDASLLLSEIAGTLGVREGGGLNLRQSLMTYLEGKRLLLVLDNLEQLRPFATAASAIAELLQGAPTLRILATSRAPLNVRAEREWPVPPLATPEAIDTRPDDAALTALEASPAVALFLDRARAARPAWGLNSANAADVVEIARRLEGVPLAIELAAARIRVLAPKDMVQRLGSALDLLASRAGDRPDRQQTLRAAIAWSHDLLSFENQAAFRRLGVFAGGFTLEAAEKVLIDAPDPWVDALDAISVLVEQSLLRAEEEPDGETRYRMLETIRTFAVEELASSREEPGLRRAHAAWAEAFARDADSRYWTAESGEWLERSERELDNYRAALSWAIQQDAHSLGLRLPETLWRLWQTRGLYAEGRSWISQALEAGPEASPEMRALVLEGLAGLAWKQGDLLVAAAAYEESLATWRAAGKLARAGGALTSLGIIVELRGDIPRAISLQEEAVAIAREVGDQSKLAISLNNLGTVLQTAGEDARSTALLEESVAIKRAMGNIAGLASSLTNLAILAVNAGNVDLAIRHLEEVLAIDRQVGNAGGAADTLGNLAAVTSESGDIARAAALDAEALVIRHELGDRLSMAYGLESIASTVSRAGQPHAGVRLFGAADRLRQEIGAPLPASEHERYEKGLQVARAAISDEEFAREWETGQGLPLDYAVEEALHAARAVAAMGEPVSGAPASLPTG